LTIIFTQRQRDSILRALGIEQQARQDRYADQIIHSAIQMLRDRFEAEATKKERVYEIADQLRLIAQERLWEIARQIDDQLKEVTAVNSGLDYHAWSRSVDHQSSQSHYFWYQIVEVAKHFGYFASFERYRSWAQLWIKTDNVFEFVISFHGYGHGANGVMAASALTSLRVDQEDGVSRPIDTRPASTDLFQFNYAEEEASIKGRFADWIEHAIAIALGEWRRNLVA
jgi:hypothetical protein